MWNDHGRNSVKARFLSPAFHKESTEQEGMEVHASYFVLTYISSMRNGPGLLFFFSLGLLHNSFSFTAKGSEPDLKRQTLYIPAQYIPNVCTLWQKWKDPKIR